MIPAVRTTPRTRAKHQVQNPSQALHRISFLLSVRWSEASSQQVQSSLSYFSFEGEGSNISSDKRLPSLPIRLSRNLPRCHAVELRHGLVLPSLSDHTQLDHSNKYRFPRCISLQCFWPTPGTALNLRSPAHAMVGEPWFDANKRLYPRRLAPMHSGSLVRNVRCFKPPNPHQRRNLDL